MPRIGPTTNHQNNNHHCIWNHPENMADWGLYDCTCPTPLTPQDQAYLEKAKQQIDNHLNHLNHEQPTPHTKDTMTTKHHELLNTLHHMETTLTYALRRQTLRDTQQLIHQQEQQITQLTHDRDLARQQRNTYKQHLQNILQTATPPNNSTNYHTWQQAQNTLTKQQPTPHAKDPQQPNNPPPKEPWTPQDTYKHPA
jgi:hypothetical protein